METEEIKNWRLGYLENKRAEEESFSPETGAEVEKKLKCIRADVPGNFELDLMREKLLPDLYFGTNILLCAKARKSAFVLFYVVCVRKERNHR